MGETLIEKLTNTPEKARLFQQERTSLELMELVCEVMQQIRASIPPSHESYDAVDVACGWGNGRTFGIMNGEARIELDDASDILHALGKSLRFIAEPLET